MKISYYIFGGGAKVTSVSKKVDGQIKGLNGIKGISCKGYMLSLQHSKKVELNDSLTIIPIANKISGWFPAIKTNKSYYQKFKDLLEKDNSDIIYLRFSFINKQMAQLIKQHPNRIILELNSFYVNEAKVLNKSAKRGSILDYILSYYQEVFHVSINNLFYRKTFYSSMLGISCISNQLKEFILPFNSNAIHIPNGIDVSLHNPRIAPANFNKFHILITIGASNHAPWVSPKRLINSVIAHKLEHKVIVHIASRIPQFDEHAFVQNHGYQDKQGLSTLYNLAHIGAGNLELYKLGKTEDSTLKIREYLACGLPAIFCGNDIDIETTEFKRYCYKIPNDNSIIDLPYIIDWCKTLYKTEPNHPETMHQLAKNHLDFSIKAKQLVDFIQAHA